MHYGCSGLRIPQVSVQTFRTLSKSGICNEESEEKGGERSPGRKRQIRSSQMSLNRTDCRCDSHSTAPAAVTGPVLTVAVLIVSFLF